MSDPTQTTKSGPSMTPSERQRWWGIHGATIDGSDEDKFAINLAERGLIQLQDGMANANYWTFTDLGRRLYFGENAESV